MPRRMRRPSTTCKYPRSPPQPRLRSARNRSRCRHARRGDVDDEPGIETIVVAVGGGGIHAGIAAAAEGRARGGYCRTVLLPDPARSARRGPPRRCVSVRSGRPTWARRVGKIAFSMASRVTPTSLLVDDDAIVSACCSSGASSRIPAEHGAATAFAALTSGAYQLAAGERVAVVVRSEHGCSDA